MTIKLDSDTTLYPDEILPGYSCDLATAVRVKIKKRGVKRDHFGLICDPRYPARISEIQKFRDLGSNVIITPVKWFVERTSHYNTQTPILVFERPEQQKPMFQTLDDVNTSIHPNWIIDNLMVPSLRLMERMSAANLTHRAIMPTNIFGDSKMNRPVLLGQCFTSPAGSMQHNTFELRHYAMAERFGRGPGSWQNDVFALGVTVLSLFLGRVPYRNVNFDALMANRLNYSPLHIFTEGASIPERLMVLLRGMLQDDPASMMTIPELLDWVFKRKSSSHPIQKQTFSAALRYRQVDHQSLQSLANSVANNWDDARLILSSDRVISWVTRSVPHQQMPQGLLDRMRQLSEMDPHSAAMELAIAKILILMDRDAPIRLPGYYVCSDALLSHACVHINDEDVLGRLYYVLRNELFSFWSDQQQGEGQETKLSNIFSFQSGLSRLAANDDISLHLYDFYPDLPCRSQIVSDFYILTTKDCILALEKIVEGRIYNNEWFPMDRHIHAFLRSHAALERISIPWRTLNEGSPSVRQISEIGIIIAIQLYLKLRNLNNLFEYTRSMLLAFCNRIKLRVRREGLHKQLSSLKNNGNLHSLMLLWRDGSIFTQDKNEFNQALRYYRSYILREKWLMERRSQAGETSQRLSGNLSALVGSVTGLGGLLLLLVLTL